MHRCRWAHMARMPKQMQAPTCNLYSPPPKHHSRSIAFRHSIAHQQQERHPYPLSHSHLLPRSLTPPTDPSLPPSRRSPFISQPSQPSALTQPRHPAQPNLRQTVSQSVQPHRRRARTHTAARSKTWSLPPPHPYPISQPTRVHG
ncbi:uncharacterized protein BKA78DRAFT_319836 [Phyllosticta capitalensis]|uniref:uncharacterized protein n=1 Tax=Phyllosticta capitalensis TaxID=121624 RepID=UPI00312E620A